ncbi:MAG: hypothetical protein WDO74_26020 [Pseudomonadota bacterium]
MEIAHGLGSACELRGRQPMFRHIHGRADELDELTRVVGQRMARCVLIANIAVRKHDSIASPIVHVLLDGALELLLNASPILRVDPIEPELWTRGVLTGQGAVDAQNLRRAFDNAGCLNVAPSSGAAETLHFEQMGLALHQRLLGQFSVVDVRFYVVPARHAIGFSTRAQSPQLEPAIIAIRAQ